MISLDAVLRTMMDATSTPKSLTISKVQEAIESSYTQNANAHADAIPKSDSFLQYLVLTTTSSNDAQADPFVKDIGIDNFIRARINKKKEVTLDIFGKTSTKTTLRSVLERNGLSVFNCYKDYACSAAVPIDFIKRLSLIPEIVKMNLAIPRFNHYRLPASKSRQDRRALRGRGLQGSVQSEAVRAMFLDTALSRYNNINGTGITVGILSDSFDCQRNQTQIDVQSGDLPPVSRINVLADYFESDCTDEGRAMMQLVYDISPGVNFAFHTGSRSEVDFAAGIIALANAGCQIIVDDVGYFSEPLFQDGIVAQAIDNVVSRGVPHFAAVGNSGNIAWDGTAGFKDSTIKAYNGTFHSYGLDTNGSHVVLQPFRTRRRNRDLTFLFQWDEPFISPKGNGGSRSILDIYVLDGAGNVLSRQPEPNVGSDPYRFVFFNTVNVTTAVNSTTAVVYVAIVLSKGPPPTYMKIISLNGGTFDFSTGTEGTNWGHPNSASVAAVGAADVIDTPAYNVSPPVAELYSSFGGIPTFFDTESNRLPAPEIRRQPLFVGPDGVSTTFFSPPENLFYGTSAAAPNVAGVAALMLQLHAVKNKKKLTPFELYRLLESTAIDMTSTIGFDFPTGYGFVNASSALDAVAAIEPTKAPSTKPTKAPSRAPIVAPVNPPTNCGLFGWNLFCPRRGKCGLLRRLFKIHGC